MSSWRKTVKRDILAKKTISSINKDPAKLYFVSKHGISIYPIPESEYKSRRGSYASKSNKWYIEVNNNGKIKTFDKVVPEPELTETIWKTINYYYKLLTEKK